MRERNWPVWLYIKWSVSWFCRSHERQFTLEKLWESSVAEGIWKLIFRKEYILYLW